MAQTQRGTWTSGGPFHCDRPAQNLLLIQNHVYLQLPAGGSPDITSLPTLLYKAHFHDTEHQVAHTQSESATFYCGLERNVCFLFDLLVDFLLYFLIYFMVNL